MQGITCPSCGLQMPVIQDLVGRQVSCPECGFRFTMATAEAPPVISGPSSSGPSAVVRPTVRSTSPTRFQSKRPPLRESTSVVDVLTDFGFRVYLTPLIVKIMWALTVAFMAWWVITATYLLLPQASGSRPRPSAYERPGSPTIEFAPPAWVKSGFLRFSLWASAVWAARMAILTTRLMLEFWVVQFHSALFLSDIRDSLQSES